MRIRPFQMSDIGTIHDFNRRFHSNLDPIEPAQAYADIVADDKDGILVAYGINRLLSEAIMVLDHDRPLRDKVEALKLLMEEAKSKCCHNLLYTRTQDRQFEAILCKHFGFRRSEGVLLVSDVR
jgi:hypothetical protein